MKHLTTAERPVVGQKVATGAAWQVNDSILYCAQCSLSVSACLSTAGLQMLQQPTYCLTDGGPTLIITYE